MKFFPEYELRVETATKNNVSVALPYSAEFTVSRNSLAAANTASFKLYNLKQDTRNLIFHDAFDVLTRRAVQFFAGYKGFVPLIFNGTLLSAQSYRVGSDMVTEINAQDGAFQMVNGFVSTTQVVGQSDKELLRLLSENLPQIKGRPVIGDFPKVSSRGTVLFGNTWNLIQEMSGGQAFIDNGEVRIIKQDEYLKESGSNIPVINSSTGLLESPRRSTGNLYVEVNLLFEPRMTVGQLVQLDSGTNTILNGTYKVVGFTHTGIISLTVGGARTTRAFLYKGNVPFKPVLPVPVAGTQ